MAQQHASPYASSPGDIYERLIAPTIFAPWTRDLVPQAAVQPGERVLDLACGTGIVARAVAVLPGGATTIVGLDRNPDMLATARAVAAGLPITWREGDAAALPFPDGSFDVALCQQGLQFMAVRRAALAELRRVLAPGGRAKWPCSAPLGKGCRSGCRPHRAAWRLAPPANTRSARASSSRSCAARLGGAYFKAHNSSITS